MATVDAEIRAGIAELELSDQDYVSLALHHWGKFDYACSEYHVVGLKPLELPPWCSEVADEGVQILASCLKKIDSCLTQEVSAEFSQGLYFMEDIRGLVDRVVSHLLSLEYSVIVKKITDDVHANLPSLKNLIDSMDLSEVNPCTRPQGLHSNAWHSLFGSSTGCGFMSACLQQVMQFRFTFCRNLLVLQGLIVAAGQNRGALGRHLSLISRKLIPETQRLVRAYFAALWVTEAEGSPLSNLLEGGIKGMSISSSADGFGVISQNAEQCGLVWIFLRNGGGEAVRRQLSEKGPPEASQIWAPILPSFISAVAELIWPLSDNCVFPRSLLELGQHLQLHEYVRLLTDWCGNNRETRMYLLATSFLEPYIIQQIQRVGSSDPSSEQSLLPLYYQHVIRAFTDAPDCVITLAEAALKRTPRDDPHVPVLWSLLFKHQLQLGHITEAYHAMIQNPIADHRNNCLQQLVIVLCERGQLSTLVNFPFKGVESDVIRILETRARATDALERRYYDVLYCMHVNANKYRRAASAMYEHALRLQEEAGTLEALKRQELCLLAAINCLLLVKAEDAWVAMPLPVGRADRSPKRDSTGEEIPHAPTRKVEVIQVEDMRRKLSLVRAWLLLSGSNRDPITLPLSPGETVLLLVGSGHFNLAIHICKQFSMNLDPVFEGVVQQCLKSSPVQTIQSARAINPQWIIENPKAVLDIPGQAWLLLRHYLKEHEKERGTTRYHRLIASKLLCNGFLLPPWLTESYKERDAPELLRLLIAYSRLEEATDISIEYVDAVLGKGKEYFGLTSALHASSPPVWLPHTTFDRLLVALKSSGQQGKPISETGPEVEGLL
ncbi:hypothetical protein MTO96_007488 [Rhipicephalus appendiculatus]